MALQKTIELSNGATCNYHKIQEIRVQNSDQQLRMDIAVASYVSSEIRKQDENLNLTMQFFDFELTQEEVESKPIFQLGYEKLKTLEAFQDAEDC